MSFHIIAPGTYKWRGTCTRCGCVFECGDGDAYEERNWDGTSAIGVFVKAFVPCPQCGKDTDLTEIRKDD